MELLNNEFMPTKICEDRTTRRGRFGASLQGRSHTLNLELIIPAMLVVVRSFSNTPCGFSAQIGVKLLNIELRRKRDEDRPASDATVEFTGH